MNLKDLFKRKIKEIESEIESSEQRLRHAEEKIRLLKASPKANLLRDELRELLKTFAWKCEDRGRRKSDAYFHMYTDNHLKDQQINQLHDEIKYGINELCRMAATKENV